MENPHYISLYTAVQFRGHILSDVEFFWIWFFWLMYVDVWGFFWVPHVIMCFWTQWRKNGPQCHVPRPRTNTVRLHQKQELKPLLWEWAAESAESAVGLLGCPWLIKVGKRLDVSTIIFFKWSGYNYYVIPTYHHNIWKHLLQYQCLRIKLQFNRTFDSSHLQPGVQAEDFRRRLSVGFSVNPQWIMALCHLKVWWFSSGWWFGTY